MICKFCQKECCPIGEDSRCFRCNVAYHDGFYDMFYRHRSTLYCLQVREQIEECRRRAIGVDATAVLIKGHPGYIYQVIIKFDSIPNITPQNFQEKLKLYLTFS